MSGIFLGVMDAKGKVMFPDTSGGKPHTTVVYFAWHDPDAPEKNAHRASAVMAAAFTALSNGFDWDRTYELASVKVNTFYHEGLGRDRTDVLLVFDDEAQAILASIKEDASNILLGPKEERMVDAASEGAAKKQPPPHVTVATDVDAHEEVSLVAQWTALLPISIRFTTLYPNTCGPPTVAKGLVEKAARAKQGSHSKRMGRSRSRSPLRGTVDKQGFYTKECISSEDGKGDGADVYCKWDNRKHWKDEADSSYADNFVYIRDKAIDLYPKLNLEDTDTIESYGHIRNISADKAALALDLCNPPRKLGLVIDPARQCSFGRLPK